jgi:serine/threonine protein kinase
MDNLGPNLENLYNKCGRQFSLKTVLSIADQLLGRLEFLHQNNIIHRDLKPENFCVGLKEKSDQIYMIDLGIAKKYRDPRTKMHIPFQQN